MQSPYEPKFKKKKKKSKPKVIDQSEFLELSKGKIYRYSSKEFIIKSTKDRFSLS